MKPRCFGLVVLALGLLTQPCLTSAATASTTATASPTRPMFTSRANSVPRKVVIASALANFSGAVEARLKLATQLLDNAAREAAARYQGRGLDLIVFPEFALCQEKGTTAAERSVSLSGSLLDTLGAAAREYHTWIIMPMTLREDGASERFSNAAVLFDRTGRVAGIFRKVHPIADENGVFEGGITPGENYPVFECDFGRLGILICWDMVYEEAWDALAAAGAELVALPTASPQTLRPSAQALRHRYYVVNSAPRDNSSVFDPIGRIAAQVTTAPGVVVHEIDLSFAILHWTEALHEGRALTDRFGSAVGGNYSSREDSGVFWSNDSQRSIGTMIRELGLPEMPEAIEQMETLRLKAGRSR